MENNTVPSSVSTVIPSDRCTTHDGNVSIRIRPDFARQLLGGTIIAPPEGNSDNHVIDGSTLYRLEIPKDELRRYLRVYTESPFQETITERDTGVPGGPTTDTQVSGPFEEVTVPVHPEVQPTISEEPSSSTQRVEDIPSRSSSSNTTIVNPEPNVAGTSDETRISIRRQDPYLLDYFTDAATISALVRDGDFEDIIDTAFNPSYTVLDAGPVLETVSSASNNVPDEHPPLPTSQEDPIVDLILNNQGSKSREDILSNLIALFQEYLSSTLLGCRKYFESVIDILRKAQASAGEIPWAKISIAIAILAFVVSRRLLSRAQILAITTALQTAKSVADNALDSGGSGSQVQRSG